MHPAHGPNMRRQHRSINRRLQLFQYHLLCEECLALTSAHRSKRTKVPICWMQMKNTRTRVSECRFSQQFNNHI